MNEKNIGKFIAELRKEKVLTQRELGDILGVTDKTVSHWERGETSPDVSFIPTIAKTLGVTIDELLKGEKNQPDKAGSEKDDDEGFQPFPFYSTIDLNSGEEHFSVFKIINIISCVLLCIFSTAMFIGCLMTEAEYFINYMSLFGFILQFITPAIVFALSIKYRLKINKNLLPAKEADKNTQSLLFRANKILYRTLCFFIVSLASQITFLIHWLCEYHFTFVLVLLAAALIIIILPGILKRIGYLPKAGEIIRERPDTHYLKRNTIIVTVIFLLISGINSCLMLIQGCPPKYYQADTEYTSADQFRALMEIENDPFPTEPDYDGPSAPSDSETVYEIYNPQTGELFVDFHWKNKQVLSYRQSTDYNTGEFCVVATVMCDGSKRHDSFVLSAKRSVLTYVFSIGVPLTVYFIESRKLKKEENLL